MRIFTSNSHPALTTYLKKIDGIEWDVREKKFFTKEQLQTVDWTHDLVLVQEPEHWVLLRELAPNVKKVVFNHNLPYPLSASPFYNMLAQDASVRMCVFATEEQAVRWQCKLDYEVIPHALDVDSFPKWDPKNDHIVSMCNNLPDREWACGSNVWRLVTRDLPQKRLYGWGNEKLGGVEQGICGEKTYEEIKQILADCAVFFNHTLHSTYPMTIAEAMAVGCPIVTTNTYFPSKMLAGGMDVVSNILPELRTAVSYLSVVSDPDAWETNGLKNRAKIKEYMDPQKFIYSWKKVFEDAANH